MQLKVTLCAMVMEQYLMEPDQGSLVMNLLEQLLRLMLTIVHKYILTILKKNSIVKNLSIDFIKLDTKFVFIGIKYKFH